MQSVGRWRETEIEWPDHRSRSGTRETSGEVRRSWPDSADRSTPLRTRFLGPPPVKWAAPGGPRSDWRSPLANSPGGTGSKGCGYPSSWLRPASPVESSPPSSAGAPWGDTPSLYQIDEGDTRPEEHGRSAARDKITPKTGPNQIMVILLTKTLRDRNQNSMSAQVSCPCFGLSSL